MNDQVTRRAQEIQGTELFRRVKELQALIVESAKAHFDDSELGHLRAVIRLTVEFQDYLEHGSVEIARGIQQQSYLGLTSGEFREEVGSACTDPLNKYDLGYVCGSILSGIDSFRRLSTTYRRLFGTADSSIIWGMVSSRETFKAEFVLMFNKFAKEANFENKCRLLLDLFKLQIVFAGISYNG